MKTVAMRAISAWLVQMLEVAFSRRICCSRVASVKQNARLPRESVVSPTSRPGIRSEEHTSELQSRVDLVCCLLLEKKKKNKTPKQSPIKHTLARHSSKHHSNQI